MSTQSAVEAPIIITAPEKPLDPATAQQWRNATIFATAASSVAAGMILVGLCVKTVFNSSDYNINYAGADSDYFPSTSVDEATCGRANLVHAAAVANYLALFSAFALVAALAHELKTRKYISHLVAVLFAVTTAMLLLMSIFLGIVRDGAVNQYCRSTERFIGDMDVGSGWGLAIAAQLCILFGAAVYICSRYMQRLCFNADGGAAVDAAQAIVAKNNTTTTTNDAKPWLTGATFAIVFASIATALLVIGLSLKTILYTRGELNNSSGNIRVTYYRVRSNSLRHIPIDEATCGQETLIHLGAAANYLAMFSVAGLVVALAHELKSGKFKGHLVAVLFVVPSVLLLAMHILLGVARGFANANNCNAVQAFDSFKIGECWAFAIAAQMCVFVGGAGYVYSRYKGCSSSDVVGEAQTIAAGGEGQVQSYSAI